MRPSFRLTDERPCDGLMRSNAEVDFVISDADMDALRSMEQKDYGDYSAFPVYSGK